MFKVMHSTTVVTINGMHRRFKLTVRIALAHSMLKLYTVQLNSSYTQPHYVASSPEADPKLRTRQIQLELLQVTGKILLRFANIHILEPQSTY